MTERFDEQHDETMAGLLRALETAPEIEVPADFSARVIARVPARHARAATLGARALTPRYGRAAAFTALGVLAASMVLVTYFTGASGTWSLLEFVLLAQLAVFVVWISFASWRSQ